MSSAALSLPLIIHIRTFGGLFFFHETLPKIIKLTLVAVVTLVIYVQRRYLRHYKCTCAARQHTQYSDTDTLDRESATPCP